MRLYVAIVHNRFFFVVRENNNQMVCCFPSTPKKLAMTLACFLGGASIFAIGVHLSYVNVAPQQARTKARNEFVKERLRKKYGKLASDWGVCHCCYLWSADALLGLTLDSLEHFPDMLRHVSSAEFSFFLIKDKRGHCVNCKHHSIPVIWFICKMESG